MSPRHPGHPRDTVCAWRPHGKAWQGTRVLLAAGLCHLLLSEIGHAALPFEWPPGGTQPQLESTLPAKAEPSLSEGSGDFSTLLSDALPRFQLNPQTVPAFFQEQVRKRLQDFASLYQEELQSMFQRARPHLPMIKLILAQHHVPGYFAFVPLVESAFQPLAEHPVSRARGLWQLLPDTARWYGIQVSPAHDERIHPARATQAAARYLRYLNDLFGFDSPLHVLAAYNWGEQNLLRAMLRARTRDIWTLFAKRYLPYQTRDYLVKMVTYWVLTVHAERFRVALEPDEVPKATDAAYSPAAFSSGGLRGPLGYRRTTDPRPPQPMNPLVAVWIPSVVSTDRSRYADNALLAPVDTSCTQPVHFSPCWHTVENGESLWTIAQRYERDVGLLKWLNQLEGQRPIIRPGQQLAVCANSFPRVADDSGR